MKHLVYCVLRNLLPARGVLPAGIEGAPVFLVAEGGLAAACSVAPDAWVTPTVPRATAFAWVVAALHKVAAVVPFRYGNSLENREQVLELMQAHRAQFLQCLEEVQGCDEMGLRILLENRPEHSVRAEHAPYTAHKNPCRVGAVHPPSSSHKHPCRVGAVHPPSSSHTRPGPACVQPAYAAPAGTGREFLEGRRAHYAAEECDEALAAQAAAEARGALEGLAVKCREDRSSAADGRLLSLFFLVRRKDVERFREAFRQLQQETSAKMLLTGPWPPYNFVGSPCPDGRAERD